MTGRSLLLLSSALLTLTGAPAYAQATASTPPDTSYGSFVPLATGSFKSYADGRMEGGASLPQAAPVQPAQPAPVATAPVTSPETVQIAAAPTPEAIAEPAPTSAPAPTAAMAPIPDPAPAPVAEAEAASVAAPSVVAPAPEIKPAAAIASSPVLDEQFPEEREAMTRLAAADVQQNVSEMGRVAAALAELPPVPEDVIANVPLSDRPIREIAVVGLERIEPLTVESYLDVVVGEVLTAESRNASLKSLYASGLFADVAIAQTGDILTVEVKENPQINQIAFEGNKRLKDEDLQREIQLRPRAIYTRQKALEDADRMLGMYRASGRYAARVDPKIIERDQNRVDLAFEINEGPVTDVRSVRFVGNKAFDDGDLREAISTKIARWYRFYASDDRYDPDRVNYDQELLRQFYLKHGYADFKVVSALAELTPDQEDFYLTFTIEEGERYRVGAVTIDSQLKKVDLKPLEDEITVEQGDWYNAEKLDKIVDGMTTALGNQQYAFAAVRPDVKRNPESKTVDIAFKINESPKVYVERIDIKGNVRTLDKVVRREIELAEGDPFNKEKLARSEKQVKDLNFFRTTDIKVKEGSTEDQVIIEADVEEQSTGDIMIGAGYSTLDGPLADFQIRERNLLGKGQDLRLGATVAGRRSEVDVSFTEPYFLDRKLQAGVDVFHITRDLQRESSYDQKKTGGGFRLGYDLSENWRQAWRTTIENNEIANVQSTASRFIRDQEGKRMTTALGHRLSYDTRDSKITPKEGMNAWIDTEIAGLTDAQYLANRVGATWYYPLSDNWTFSQLGEVGHIAGYGGKDVEINERFFIGGTTMRGFAYGGIGPRDTSTEDALGGNTFYRGTSEVSFPISIDADLPLKGHFFADYGSLWSIDEPDDPNLADEASIRVAAGFGLSWESPFGPLRIDFSNPVVKEEYDEKEVVRFSFGTSF